MNEDIFKREKLEQTHPLKINLSITPVSSSPILSREVWHINSYKKRVPILIKRNK